MKKNLTELVFILDESGSMFNLTDDTIGGFNSMIEKQKKEEGKALVTTYLFNGKTKMIHDRSDLEKIALMTRDDYRPNGCTALLDAVGEAVEHIEGIHKYAREEDIPEHTVFVITTDGMENASRKYSRPQIKELIEGKQKQGWEFIFMGANIDAVAEAGSLGIDSVHAVEYVSDVAGSAACYESMTCAISNLRASRPLSKEWKKSVEADKKSRK